MDWGRNKIVTVGKNFGTVLSRLWTKVREILGRCRRPSYFPMSLPDCRCHVSFRRYSPLISKSSNKTNKNVKVFGPHFFREGRPRLFCGRLLARFTVHRLAQYRLSSVCWPPCAKPGNEVECRIYVGWVKMHVQFEAVYGPKFMSCWGNVKNPCSCQRTYPIVYIVFHSEDIGR